MKISVIIPCHNGAPFIQGALQSVAQQTCEAHEIIVIDDGSTDDSIEKVQSSGVQVRLLEVEHRNAAATRNAGIEEATGDWLAFLDADNSWYPHHLEQARALLSGTDDVALISYAGQVPAPEGPPALAANCPFDEPRVGLHDSAFVELRLAEGYGFPTTGQVLRTSTVRAVGGFDASQERRHDFELFMRVIHGRTWAFHPTASWWRRPPRTGDISDDDVHCRYYALRAMILNEERYAGSRMEALIARSARQLMIAALSDGSLEEIQSAWGLAESHLDRRDRWLLSIFRRFPGLWPLAYRSWRALPRASSARRAAGSDEGGG